MLNLTLIAFFALHAVAQTDRGTLTSASVTKTKNISFMFHEEAHELSGLFLENKSKELYAVTDTKTEHPSIYKLISSTTGTMMSGQFIDLSTFGGFSEYIEQANALPVATEKKFQVFDFEGITKCGPIIYLANERIRQIVEVNLETKSIRRLPVDFNALPLVAEGGLNAGFEGIAADCESGLLYVAKERAPRQIFVVNLKTNHIQDQFTITSSENYIAEAAGYNASKPKLELNDDFADITFENGFLYVLERNAYEITKVDLKSKTVVGRLSFGSPKVRTLYVTNEPFGLAEGLALSKNKIFIALDNNETEVQPSQMGSANPPKKNSSLLLTLRRPKGF